MTKDLCQNIVAHTARYIFDGEKLLSNQALLIADNLVVALVDKHTVPDNLAITDWGEKVISRGMIDLQLNGCGGVLFNADISLHTLETMHLCNLRFGTTGYLPTLITSPFNEVLKALETVKQWFSLYGNQRGVLGLHLEGPFIAREKRGIHQEEYILPPSEELLEQIVAYRKYFPLKMTIAPECFTAAQIAYLIEHKVILSVGHSNASYQEAASAFKQGVTTVTHMFNAMSGMSARNPGVVAAALAMAPYLGVIVDLLHVDSANVALLNQFRAGKLYLVTDAVTPTGTAISEFDFAGKHLWVREGKCVDKAGTLGGAYLTMNQALYNCVRYCDIPLAQALAMATRIPARIMGLEDELGKIKVGSRADLIVVDLNDFSCQLVTSS